MDGRDHQPLHTTNLHTPYALAIDYATQTLYWADYTLNKLESSMTDGTNRRLLNSNLRDPYAMTFYNGNLYWTDWAYNGISILHCGWGTKCYYITPLLGC